MFSFGSQLVGDVTSSLTQLDKGIVMGANEGINTKVALSIPRVGVEELILRLQYLLIFILTSELEDNNLESCTSIARTLK